jgi:uncharacterized protein DUF6429
MSWIVSIGVAIDDPVTKAKSVRLTEEGAARSKRLFEQHFGK